MQSLTDLYIYPIKSTKGIQLPQTFVEEKGLTNDRRYMLVDLDGKFITGRTHPQLTQVTIEFSKKGLLVSAPKQPSIYIQPEHFTEQMQKVEVWADNMQAQHCHPDYDQWFSTYLKQDCQLVYFSENTTRCVKNRTNQVSFADGYPLLLINQASVDELNTHLNKPVTALHFRPNLIVKGESAFIEDTWLRIKIGEVEFEVSKPCSRCNFTNVDPLTGVPDLEQPLKTLAGFRFHDGDIDFGQNLIPLNEGVICAGDSVQVLETQQPPQYTSMLGEEKLSHKAIQIYFSKSDIKVAGNDNGLLLEQAEAAGINIPFSCRGGKCGRCKTKLLSGEVKVLNNQGMFKEEIEDGYVLACSCIPKTDISIEH
ncbi:MOSC domain-containing protein [Psychromonas sp. 14N.309.X.WAT.B.A12]|uniref:YcbX family protein n=1 Tax=Psychromonas sp. 14N.309.X.WAT.B.A12 TaxID=2998322 RepID=UPI0025AEEE09|nr:MOSC N-terminal beta barrel domain-containing protein [Psychromonas sp. 14N.309.X.WAT.B.A12]MDN2664023.1 MOSC domain-containing protein [Psychromonas sp. 14N.309.X.WAT.B.A12]